MNRSNSGRRKKVNDREHNATPHQLPVMAQRGSSGKYASSTRFAYDSSGNLFQKKPTATVFGNYWDHTAAPLARMTNSASVRNQGMMSKYKPGHVRKETRIRMAMEKMKKMEAQQKSTEQNSSKKVKFTQ